MRVFLACVYFFNSFRQKEKGTDLTVKSVFGQWRSPSYVLRRENGIYIPIGQKSLKRGKLGFFNHRNLFPAESKIWLFLSSGHTKKTT